MSLVASSSFFSGLIAAAVAVGLGTADPAAATSFTWAGPGGTVDAPNTGMWNAAANWRELQVPTSEGGTQLVFRPGTAAYTATNNIQMAPFVLNSLFAVTRGGTGTAAITVDGNALSFVPNAGNPPLVSQQTAAPLTLGFGTIGIANNSNLVFSGTGTGRVTVSGVLAGSSTAGLDMRGSYVLELSGKGDNTYEGPTIVRSGQLDLNKPDVAVPGELQIGERGSMATPIVRLLAEPGLSEDGKVVFAGPGRFDVNGKTINLESVRTLQGAAGKASVSIGAGQLTIEGDRDVTHTYAGALSASGGKAPGTFVLHAPRYTLVFDNADGKGFDGTAFQGVLEVDVGVLQFSGAVLGKNAAGSFCDHVAVRAGATLRGTGSIYCQKPPTGTIKGVKVFANGALVVGNSTGLLQVIEIELDPAAVLGIHIDGSTSSLLEVLGGDVVIDESRLDVILDSPPLLGHDYLIVQSDGTSPGLGRFQGLPESGDLLFAVRDGVAYGFSIDYAAGDGNDIALRAESAQALPLPGAIGLLVVGLAAMIAGGALRTPRASGGSAGAPCHGCHHQCLKSQNLP